MAGSRQVTIQFLGDAKGLISATNSAGKSTTTLGDKLKRVGKAALIGFGTATLVAGKAMYDMAEAAIEDEKSAALLARTLQNATGATKGQISAVEDWITAQGKAYGVADDDLRPAISKLATATGDLSKAQDLASLAMDVSAGTGKDLQSITLALAKAQNGSLAGLGRLGVATKDAAGETKTLGEITDDLASKYRGAASTAAETAAGKFQRLKLELSETGESIGYKLLPYANELGDWLLSKGVPALENGARAAKRELTPALKDLAGFVGENKDEFADLGHEVLTTVIPALRQGGEMAGTAVRFFSALPEPIKSIGAEAAIAAVVIPRLTTAINGVSTAVGLGTTKVAGWRKGLLLAAGIGGVAAIEEGSRRGSKAVTVLGTAMTGAFVGGTIGSAIPGIGTAIGALGGAAVGAGVGLIKVHKGADSAGESASSASPKIDGLKESLNQMTGATTRATKALILHELQEKGVTTSASQLGIASSDLIKSVNGNEKAIKRVNDAWAKNGNLLDGLQNQKISEFLGGMRAELSKDQKELKDTNAALDGTDRAARRAAAGLKQPGKDRPSTDKWTALYSGDLNKAVNQTGMGSAKMRALLGGVTTGANKGVTSVRSLAQAVGNLRSKSIDVTVEYHYQGRPPSNNAGAGGPATRSATGGNVIHGNFGLDGTKGSYADALLGQNDRALQQAGNGLIVSITKGLKKGERTLKNVLAGIQDYLAKKTEALKDLLDQRSSFVDSFRSSFSENLFGAQFTDAEGNALAPTVDRMLQFAQQQNSNANSLAANVQSLLGKGLSKDLIDQLVGQGQSGYDQIAALAAGTQAQIQQFNALNAATRSTLEGLGVDLFNALNPGVQDQIKILQNQVDAAARQEALLQRIADTKTEGDIHIKGTDLVITLRRVERQTGRQLLVTPA